MKKRYEYSHEVKYFSVNTDYDMEEQIRSGQLDKVIRFMTLPVKKYKTKEANMSRKCFTASDGAQIPFFEFAPKMKKTLYPAIVYLHGGGFIYPVTKGALDLSARYAANCGIKVFLADYRVLPKVNCDRLHDDCYEMLQYVFAHADDLQVDPQRVILYGDSAGGALVANTAIRNRNEERFPILALVMTCPACDNYSGKYASHDEYEFAAWSKKANKSIWSLIKHTGCDDIDRYAPIKKDLHDLPQAYVEVNEMDILRDEGIAFASKLKAAGVPTECNLIGGAYHGFDADMKSPLVQRTFAHRYEVISRFLNGSEEKTNIDNKGFNDMDKKFNSIHDLQKWPEMKDVGKYLFYAPRFRERMVHFIPYDKISETGGWNNDSIQYGLERLTELTASGEKPQQVYPATEIRKDRSKKDVNLIHFPAITRKEGAPYVIVIAGGGYCAVCSIVEAYPVAARMNELGYDAFVLNYRVGIEGLMPKPLDDLAAAVRYIQNNEKVLGVNGNNYIVCGFSAGGNLTALWGTEKLGWAHYDLPAPKALFPIYAPTTSVFYDKENAVIVDMMKVAYGKNKPFEKAADYDVIPLVTQQYPPTFLCCNKDDKTVDYRNSIVLHDKLKELSIPTELLMGEKGDHGFGEGRGLEVEGWIRKALNFANMI